MDLSKQFTVKEIKDILREMGLKLSGNKQELLDRLRLVLLDYQTIQQMGGGKSSEALWLEHADKLKKMLKKDPSYRDNVDYLTRLPPAFKETSSLYKKYLQWMVESYLDGGIKRYEDVASRAYPAFDDYMLLHQKGSLKPDERNIGIYCGIVGCKGKLRKGKSPTADRIGLENLLDKYTDKLSELKGIKASKMSVEPVYRDDKVTIYQPNNVEESIHLGQGTRWCTAARNNNMFDHHNQDGPMYIVVPRRPKHPGEKYQIHTKSDQYMDEKDNEIDPIKLLGKFPQIKYFIGKQLTTNENVYWEIPKYDPEIMYLDPNFDFLLAVIDNSGVIYKNIVDVPNDYLSAKINLIYQDDTITIIGNKYIYLINDKLIIVYANDEYYWLMHPFYTGRSSDLELDSLSEQTIKCLVNVIPNIPIDHAYLIRDVINIFNQTLPMSTFKYIVDNHNVIYKGGGALPLQLPLQLATPDQVYYYYSVAPNLTNMDLFIALNKYRINQLIHKRPDIDKDRLISILGEKIWMKLQPGIRI